MLEESDFESSSGVFEVPLAALDKLTPTQLKVMQGVYFGRLNKQIAFDLGIAETTVKAHMTALMRRLNVRNRTQVAIVARRVAWGEHDAPMEAPPQSL